jgi:methionyl-tRNA synthetase
LSFIAKNCEGRLPRAPGDQEADRELLASVAAATRSQMPAAFEALALSQAVEAWIGAVFACNQYIDAQAPWTLRKTDPERMEAVLGTLVVAIRDLAIAIAPVIPGASARLLDQIGVAEGNRDFAALGETEAYAALAASDFRLAAPAPIFPRLEMPAES